MTYRLENHFSSQINTNAKLKKGHLKVYFTFFPLSLGQNHLLPPNTLLLPDRDELSEEDDNSRSGHHMDNCKTQML